MAVYHQLGHNSNNLVLEAHLRNYLGVILSPINYKLEEIQTFISNCRRGNLTHLHFIFDPQLYNPSSNRGELPTWKYFPNDVGTADPTQSDWWRNICNRLAAEITSLGVDAVCSPVLSPRSFSDEYYALALNITDLLNQSLIDIRVTDVEIYQTLIVNLSDLGQVDRAEQIASIISRTKANKVYLLLLSTLEPRRELAEPDELFGAMKLIKLLENAGLPVLVGYTSVDMVLWKAAGAEACATGKYFNLRRFTLTRFEEPSGQGGGQLSYWFEESLLAFLREPDMLRVKTLGLLGVGSSDNISGQDIQAFIRGNPGVAWLAKSWRQYMLAYQLLEATVPSNNLTRVNELLIEGETNWLRLEDESILMDEPRNNGSWIRRWRITLGDFRRWLR